MSQIRNSSDRSFLRVSKRHIVSDLSYRRQEEEHKIKKEQEDYKTLRDIADYCGMKLIQKIDSNGNDKYVLAKREEKSKTTSAWYPFATYDNFDEVKKYLIDCKKRVDATYNEQADLSASQTEREGM